MSCDPGLRQDLRNGRKPIGQSRPQARRWRHEKRTEPIEEGKGWIPDRLPEIPPTLGCPAAPTSKPVCQLST